MAAKRRAAKRSRSAGSGAGVPPGYGLVRLKEFIWNHELEEPASFIAEFEVYAAPVDPRLDAASLELLGAFESPRTVGSNPQFVEVDPERPETRWYVLRILSNHGLGEYISAAEIGLFGPEPEGLEPVESDV